MKLFAAVALSTLLKGTNIATDEDKHNQNSPVIENNKYITEHTELIKCEKTHKELIYSYASQLGFNFSGKSVEMIKEEWNQWIKQNNIKKRDMEGAI
ncbi:hypothetical protein [Chengkuizengella axinellae]|uniref:DUF2680 domain-containing protein n=1 Tax=Chengkuizengella axinellae TaxID=3064388 RepID=A0ABT9IWB7_9BACL|nr:hypothetical protein [Chengkuizengella sp. 2205SS18-9]MDP5273637.1 hypothetical protein [Chengkuizengella sp. 2205SS18-9]